MGVLQHVCCVWVVRYFARPQIDVVIKDRKLVILEGNENETITFIVCRTT